MSTLTVTPGTDTQLDPGTAALVAVTNTGAGFSALVQPWGRRLRPGQRGEFTPDQTGTTPITATGADGATTLDVTVTAAPTNSKLGVIEASNVVTAAGAALTLPAVTTATLNDVKLTANCTLTLPAATSGASFTLVLRQDATGGRTVTWSGAAWPGGVTPTLSTAANAADVLTFFASQSQWFGFVAGQAMA